MEQIRSMSKDPTDILQTMNLVDSIQLLGLDYHFQKEISEALNHIHDAHIDDHAKETEVMVEDVGEAVDMTKTLKGLKYNAMFVKGASNHMCGIKELFSEIDTGYSGNITFGDLSQRPVRGKEYDFVFFSKQKILCISVVVFNKFKEEGGSFMSTLGSDVKGLLSLYNAAYLGTHGEIILDEAISFTRNSLVSALADLKPPLTTQVSLDLETPLCRRFRRLLAREYISIYQEDATRDDAILELAKLDFNLLQSLHREELENITKWWNDLAPSKHLSFARDRLVECYFWILEVYFEPYYSRARVITTKVAALTSILDDMYDVYSTLEESQRLTEAIQRWNAKVVHQLPGYMKDYYLKLIHTFEEFEDLLASDEKYRITYLKR
nr:PREDICTED: alpha-humulene synthase-like [Musa acuminata subsp. malaccensis]